jgi:hypothetical protein
MASMPPRQSQHGVESGAAAAAVAAAAPPSSELERVDSIKGRLATLCTHEAELEVELSELDVQHATKLWELFFSPFFGAARLTLEAAHKEAVERVKAKREAVRAEINAAEGELDAAVDAPVSRGRDPTEWLPDELMLMIVRRPMHPCLYVNGDAFVNTTRLHTHVPLECSWYDSHQHW